MGSYVIDRKNKTQKESQWNQQSAVSGMFKSVPHFSLLSYLVHSTQNSNSSLLNLFHRLGAP